MKANEMNLETLMAVGFKKTEQYSLKNFKCKTKHGFYISISVGEFAYCSPRTCDATHYDEFEVAFISSKGDFVHPFDLPQGFPKTQDEVYAYVPSSAVSQLIEHYIS